MTTVDALEGFLVGVDALVDVEKRDVSKLFGAVGAWKWVGGHLSQEWLLILIDLGDQGSLPHGSAYDLPRPAG